jgi:hypothetical protein
MSGFKVAPDLTLPDQLLEWAIAILGKRNSGKTYNGGVLVEQIVQAQIPTIIFDVMGIWWGLRVGVDKEGRPDPSKPGLPVVVIGGKHADIQLDPTKIGKIVEALFQTHTSAVLDISQFRKGQQIQIATIFAEECYHLADQYPAKRVIVCEEADQFAPQRPFREEARCLGAFEDLVKLGGNRNICFIGITQRPASYNKNVLTQSDLLVVGRLTAPQDKEAIQAWVEKHADEDSKALRQWYDSLSGLRKGQMWVWNDDETCKIKQLTQFGKRITFHATRDFVLSKQAADVKLGDASEFISKFRDKFEPKPPAAVKPLVLDVLPGVLKKAADALVEDARKLHPLPSGPIRDPRSYRSADEYREAAEPITLQVRRPTADVETRKPNLQASDRDVVGRVLYAISQGQFDERQTLPKAIETLSRFGWTHARKEVEEALVSLCDLKFFTRKISSGNMFWYTVTPDAKQRIVLQEINAV